MPANSGAVHGHRYNGRILARHLAETRVRGRARGAGRRPGDIVDYLLREATRAPELWHQKAYLARVITADADGTLRDAGILPLSTRSTA